jgi:hypothetical protein
MLFDVVLSNPPFRNPSELKWNHHRKLWIEFTKFSFSLLKDGGLLCQVSPGSFSPVSQVLQLMRECDTVYINLDTERHFQGVGSTFSDYAIIRQPSTGLTFVTGNGVQGSVKIDHSTPYLPNDLNAVSLSIHRKAIFDTQDKLDVHWDYVTCHNRITRNGTTLSRTRTEEHVYPVFHTNRQVWWSSIKQPWAETPKVMWTRSGNTIPFYDETMGCTDMGYYVPVQSQEHGENLAHNLNLSLMHYLYRTAKWSGFGNEKVFATLPNIPHDRKLNDSELYDMFSLTSEEQQYVNSRKRPISKCVLSAE